MQKIFPFYNPDFDFNKSIVYEVIVKTFEKLDSKLSTTLEKLNDGNNISITADGCHKTELLDTLNLMIDETERKLNTKKSVSLANVFASILSTTIEQEQKDNLFEIMRDFNDIKESVLQGKEPESNTIDRIERAVIGEHESCAVNSMYLLKIYTLDTKTIKKYFVNLKQNNMSSSLTNCFQYIGVTGVRRLACCIIEKNLDDYNSETVSDIREYSQLFSLFVTILSDLPVYDGKFSTRGLIFALLKAAYYDGQITKEREFYSNDSLKVMASIGTSRAMKTSAAHSAKDNLQNEAREEVKKLYKSGRRLSYSEMVKEVYKNEKFLSIKHYIIYRFVKEEAERLGLGRGKNKKSTNDNLNSGL